MRRRPRAPALARRTVALLCLSLPGATATGLAAESTMAQRADGLQHRTLGAGGLERQYWIKTPAQRSTGGGLVFVLHGSNGDGPGIRELLGKRLEPLAAAAGFVVAYPDGFEKHWNDCRGGATYAANRRDVDDPAFLRAIVAAQAAESGIDPRRVFAVGFSNGGQMVLRLALEDAATYAGLAVIAASLPAPQGSDCRDDARPVPIAFFNGTADPINPFNGGLVRIGNDVSRGYVLASTATARWFAIRAGHESLARSRHLPDLDATDRSSVERLDWEAPGRTPVRLYVVHGGGHTVPGTPGGSGERRPVTNRDIDAAAESWRFFRRIEAPR